MKVRGGANKQSVLCYAIKQIWAGQVCSSRLRTPPWAVRQQEQSKQRGWVPVMGLTGYFVKHCHLKKALDLSGAEN